GLKAGGELDVHTTLCKEVRSARAAVFIDQASADPVYCNHHTPRIYSIESYAAVPIVLADGSYFGNLCAIDRRPAKVSDPRVQSMFASFAELIGQQLDNERRQEQTHAALLDEQAAGELREQFIAILGHDLRNPLSAISACSQLLERKAKDPDIANLASRITTNTKRMSRLIDDILDFTRLRLGGEIGLDFEAIGDLDKALAAVVAEISDAYPGRVIRSEIAIGRPVTCDRGRLQQLASNLLANAVTHGAQDRPVEFSARIVGDSLDIEVANRGEPIPAAQLGNLFRPFWQSPTQKRREGLGLGLHICDQIARAHGGRIDVTSTSGDGTRFIARLPIDGIPRASN
ncbi:MAG: GAF domain-containing sensor histidine kinase, partial [Caulobacteraceae bacterium]